LRGKLGLRLDAVDATDRFLDKLKGVSDPEKKAEDYWERIYCRV